MRNVVQNISTNFDAEDYLEKAVIWGRIKMEKTERIICRLIQQ
jgi:hypothetical protein